jgi:hypothetical protein
MDKEVGRDYNQNDIFWKSFAGLDKSPYRLARDVPGFEAAFVFPTARGDFSRDDYPLSLGYFASLLRMNGGKARIVVQDVESYHPEELGRENLICVYPMASLFKQTMDLASKIKRNNPSSLICAVNSDQHQHEMILCGPKAENFAREMMRTIPALDYVLVGEAEFSFLKLCEKIAEGNPNLEDVPACFYRKGGQIAYSGRKIEPVNFEFLPFASRDFLDRTISPKTGINSHLPRIQSSRGCVSPCTYCAESSLNITEGGRTGPWKGRDISRLVDEIGLLQKNYGVVFFNIIDSSFEDPGRRGIERMRLFCNEIQNRGLEASFKIHLRAETADRLDEGFLDMLKQSGVDVVIPGIESILEKELSSFRKITTPEKSRNALRKLDASGRFFNLLGHMMFSPILEIDDLPKKADFLRDVHHSWDYTNMSHNVIIFPGTAYHEVIKARGLVIPHDGLSPTVPYCFKDERVGFVESDMSRLKLEYPEVITLQNLLVNSMNVKSRFFNKMNKHLQANRTGFDRFNERLSEITDEVGNAYYTAFTELTNLARTGYSRCKADSIMYTHIGSRFEEFVHRARQNLDGFLLECEEKGLSTDKLYLKTWMSIMNTKRDTSGGKVE